MSKTLLVYYFLSAVFASYYVYLMLRYAKDWQALPSLKVPTDFEPNTPISVLVPARNEAQHIENCLRSILAQKYPQHLFEIILIDDHSSDNTVALANALESAQIRVLSLSECLKNNSSTAEAHNSFKKLGIKEAIKVAKGELLVCTDADCIVNPEWLRHFAYVYEQKNAKFIAAPVNFYNEQSTLERFQSLDFVGMMGITGAGIHGRYMNMCNGANLAYPREVFEAVGGFDGIDHLASGDDMLLMQKIARHYKEGIFFLKIPQATVFTHAKSTWTTFVQQRVRWASKSTVYPEHRVTFDLAMAFFFCCNIVLSLCLIPFIGYSLFLIQLLLKSIIDFYFLNIMARYFNRSDLMRSFFSAQLLHILYIVVVGTKSNITKEYEWKGRRVK